MVEQTDTQVGRGGFEHARIDTIVARVNGEHMRAGGKFEFHRLELGRAERVTERALK
jgi:hypothetical protein